MVEDHKREEIGTCVRKGTPQRQPYLIAGSMRLIPARGQQKFRGPHETAWSLDR